MEDSRMTNFIFLDRDNDRNVEKDSLKNFRQTINFGNILYIPIVILFSHSYFYGFDILSRVYKVLFEEVNNSKVTIYLLSRRENKI